MGTLGSLLPSGRNCGIFLGTKLLMSSAYHLQTDGQMERTHRTLEQTLHCLLSEGSLDGIQWYTLLPQVEFALNC